MAEVVCAGPGCEVVFESAQPHARFHADACRKAAHRGTRRAAQVEDGQPLVDAVTRELETAGKAETYAGQLAIHLARQLVAVGAGGSVGLARELRVAMADALGPRAPGGPAAVGEDEGDEGSEAEGVDDELARARASRDEVLRAMREAQ